MGEAIKELARRMAESHYTQGGCMVFLAPPPVVVTGERLVVVNMSLKPTPVVQARIRELRAERDALRRSLTLAETPDDALVAGWQEFVQRATTAIDMLSASHLTIPPEEFRQALAEIVDHVVVTARRVETGPSNHRFVLESVETRLKLDGSLD